MLFRSLEKALHGKTYIDSRRGPLFARTCNVVVSSPDFVPLLSALIYLGLLRLAAWQEGTSGSQNQTASPRRLSRDCSDPSFPSSRLLRSPSTMNLHPSFLSAISKLSFLPISTRLTPPAPDLIGLPSESHAFSASFLDIPYGDPAAHSPASSSMSGTSLSYAYSTSEPGGASQDIDPEGAEPDILVDQPDTFGSIGSYHTRESYEEGGKMGILEQGGESEGRPGAQEQTRSVRGASPSSRGPGANDSLQDRKLLCRFIVKLKYLLDNPALFGTYIRWRSVARSSSLLQRRC